MTPPAVGEELKPCPFDGDDCEVRCERDEFGRKRSVVVCRGCGARSEQCIGDHRAVTAWNTRSQSDRIKELEAERDEARRRRDEWRAKAEGFDAVRLALREKVGTPWPPHMSRLLWAGIAADERARAKELEALLEEAREALEVARAGLDAADAFITNGVALGFIRMPEPGTPDPALKTPETVRRALRRAVQALDKGGMINLRKCDLCVASF